MPEISPQPAVERIVPVGGHSLVVAVTPGQSPIVALTAAVWAEAVGGALHCAYADPERVLDEEFADGSVRHSALSPDADDDSWLELRQQLHDQVAAAIAGRAVRWEFHYLAGRADRAITHLARAVDAAAIVVGARRPAHGERLREFLATSLGAQLTRHQHRPVLAVPIEIVDWKHQVQ
ncbi:MAG TPA: universal stress protein [Propionicimonas sp.]|nr:universal stress protein [Propionicimonas sp.]HRA06145.1 universal stress protein [Propionicimonas sp.]